MPATFDNNIITIQNALVTLIGNFTDPNGGTVTASRVSSSDGILSSQLPYVVVRRGRMTARNERSVDLYTDIRQFQALVFVELLNNGELDDETQFDNALAWVKPFHKYLAQNRQITEAAEIIVQDVRDTGDVSLSDRRGKRFAGVAFTIPISYMTRF